jgi:glycosyltransferase involved in cell wall biosynthesis
MLRDSVSDSGDKRLVLYSKLALYPMHWMAFVHLCSRYRVRGTAIANVAPSLPSVHQQLGWVNARTAQQDGTSLDVRFVPAARRVRQMYWLMRELRALRPDAIWVQEEPVDAFLLAILLAFRFDRHPRIVTAVCENIFPPPKPWVGVVRHWLWPRLDGLLAVATPSIEGIRVVGMPASVPAWNLVGGGMPSPEHVDAAPLPFERSQDDFVVAFVGRVVEQKGWKVLLSALTLLPPRFKCIIAGDGEQLPQLQEWLARSEFQGRVFYLGLFPKAELWGVYRAADCLILPSIRVPYPLEQFGGVLVDAMAMGLPVIGSDVGGIPDVIGPAGIVVPDSDPVALAEALQLLQADEERRCALGRAGRTRFEAEFAIPAYAGKIARALDLRAR